MQRLMAKEGDIVKLREGDGIPEQVHVFGEREIQAVNTALAAGRPLLLRGEPGVGKSQLAFAAAKSLERAFVAKTVDANTEAHHLLWHFDAVARLAEAQVQGALLAGCNECQEAAKRSLEQNLALHKFVHPQVLWWALNWKSAGKQAEVAKIDKPKQCTGYRPSKGVVALIDEIDKADSHVPNGLLEALGAGSFKPFGLPERVFADNRSPLIIITTNEERRLPDAFIRRCLVLNMQLPKDRKGLEAHLLERARAHFPRVNEKLIQRAAQMLIDDREIARKENHYPLPGQAEYLDLLRAVRRLAPNNAKAQAELLEELGDFALKKSV